jgi:poly-gamma-glutamate synthesis protein (capsule biosynthesis protein)
VSRGARTAAISAQSVLCLLLVTACSGEDRPVADGASSVSPQPTEDEASVQAGLPDYASSVRPVSAAVASRMSSSHRVGCPVSLDDLRYVRVRFVGFDGETHTGELVVHRRYASDLTGVFRELYDARFPIERMRLIDVYDGDDDASMAAGNTSAYNCRNVAGTDRWSEHAFGRALDINPVQNPYVQGRDVAPPAGSRFAHLDRSPGARVPRGVIVEGDVVVRAFADIGWEWGGHWRSSKDYQHFSADGG